MRQGFARPLVESAMLATLSAVLMLLAFYVPVIGTVIGFVSPLPVALAVLRHGGKWGVLASTVGALVLIPLMGWVSAAALWIGFGWVGLVFGWSVRRGYRYTAVLLLTAASVVAGALAGFLATYLISGLTPLDLFDQMLEAYKAGMELAKSIAGDSPQLNQLLEIITNRDLLLRLVPGYFVLAGVFMSYINIEVMRMILPRFGYSLDPLPPFRRWVFPEAVAWLGLSGFVAIVLLRNRPELEALTIIAQNVYSVASIFGTLEVFSLTAFYLFRTGFSKIMVGLAMLLLFNLSSMSPLLSLLIPIFGMMDMLLDFRHLKLGANKRIL